MPGWHDKTNPLVARGELAVAGIVQEQHGDRAALFMQWKQMDWPVMVDSLNLLGVRAVPLTYLIDGQGVIRAVNPKRVAQLSRHPPRAIRQRTVVPPL